MEVDFLLIGVLLVASVFAGKLADRLGMPALLLFLGIGMLAGSEGVGGIQFDAPELAASVGNLALALILFSGGLDTAWRDVRPVLGKGLVLATFGVAVTALVLGAFAWFALGTFGSFDLGARGISWLEALLLAAIVSSTDAPAVFSIFRGSGIRLKGDLQPLLEFESGSNDPMAVLLTTGLLGMMGASGSTVGAFLFDLVAQLALGVAGGVALGWGAVWVMNRLRMPAAGFYPIATVGVALVTVGATQAVGGNGFLAVYVAGVVIGNRLRVQRDGVLAFHDALAWLAQVAMFLVLGLLVNPSEMLPVAGVAIALALFLMFVARPFSVAICMLPFGAKPREIAFVSWAGLRGSVPIILATYPGQAGLAGADAVFNVVFFVVLFSVVVQGLTLAPSARRLGVVEPPTPSGRSRQPHAPI